MVAGGEAYSRAVLEALPKLRIVARMGVGYDRVDVKAASDLEVLVSITPGTIEPAVAEWTVAHMLAVRRRLFAVDRAVRDGRWTLPEVLSASLVGATIGLVGLGRIGREVANRLAGFGSKLIGTDPVADPTDWRQRGVELVDLGTRITSTTPAQSHRASGVSRGTVSRRGECPASDGLRSPRAAGEVEASEASHER